MVKFLESNKHVFWEALLITIFIFSVGVIIGVSVENWRGKQIGELYLESELNLLDLKIQSEIFGLHDFDCEKLTQENIEFGDKIYREALLLKDLEESQTITDSLKQQHKKYDLLRTLFWVNSIKIKQKCSEAFHTLVYIYEYDVGTDAEAKQKVFSKYASELKNEHGDKIILIPIAGNMNLFSTQSLMQKYNIEKLPVIIIDEENKVYEIEDLQTIDSLIN